ncbi:MAG: acyltransferase [Lachnospiraceae bacterium]|nr:acyltransferase [Lachnospiraceae bacterium]
MKQFIAKYGICALLAAGMITFYDFEMGKTVLILLVVAGSGGLFYGNYRRSEKKAPGKGREKNIIVELDILRVIATVLVIALHTLEANAGELGMTDATYVSRSAVLISCNYLFIMLSGGLSFRYREQNAILYYISRGIRILIPMYIYYIWNYFWHIPLKDMMNLKYLKTVAAQLFAREYVIAPQFWLLYPIMLIYLFAPFIQYMFRSMPYKRVFLLAAVSVAAIFFILRYRSTGTDSFWLLPAVVGFFLLHPETRKLDLPIILLGLLALPLLLWGHHDSITDAGGLTCLIACGIVSLVYFICGKLKPGRIVSAVCGFFSRYSFGILLVHWYVLYYLTRDTFGITAISYGGWVMVLSTIVTFCLSLVFAYLFDNTMIYLLSTICSMLVKLGTKKFLS